jgi:hypothetical protein
MSPPKRTQHCVSYPALSEKHQTQLFQSMREEIAKKPLRLKLGYWNVAYPRNADIRGQAPIEQREYVGRLRGAGILIISTLDGSEVTRGELGWLWSAPVFDSYRKTVKPINDPTE